MEDCLDDRIRPHEVYRGLTGSELQVVFNTMDFELDEPKTKVCVDPQKPAGLTRLPENCYLVFQTIPTEWSTWASKHLEEPKVVGGTTIDELKSWMRKGKVGLAHQQVILDYLVGEAERGKEKVYIPKKVAYDLFHYLRLTEHGAQHISEASLNVAGRVDAMALFDRVGTAESLRLFSKVKDENLIPLYHFFRRVMATRQNPLSVQRLMRLEQLFMTAHEYQLTSYRMVWVKYLQECLTSTINKSSLPLLGTSPYHL